jgi:hypothetical protein
MIAASGAWAGVAAARRQQAQAREASQTARIDELNARVFRLINYAARLRDAIYRGEKPPPEEWPKDIYD